MRGKRLPAGVSSRRRVRPLKQRRLTPTQPSLLHDDDTRRAHLAPLATPSPVGVLLGHFDDLHLALLGVRAVIRRGKDAALLLDLCRSHGADLVTVLMGDYFACGDAFILSAGYTVGVFYSQFAKLIARRHRDRLPAPEAPPGRENTTAHNLRAARESLQRARPERPDGPAKEQLE